MSSARLTHARGGITHPPSLLLAGLLAQIGVSFAPDPLAGAPWALRLVGGLVLLAGIALTVAGERGFKRVGTPVRPMSPPTTLVTDGVFRLSRNPMYLGLATILLGSALALSSAWAMLVVPVFVAWVGRLIRHEERLLETTFGASYSAYRERVRRWL